MAVSIGPILKAAAPYITQLAAAAIPAFTAKPEDERIDSITAEQIEELQTAATQNAQSVQLLAEKLRETIVGIDEAAQEARKQIKFYRFLLLVSLSLSTLSMAGTLYLLLR